MADEESILTFSEDISEAEAPDPLPVGDYPASVHSIEVKTSATSGNRYLNTMFRVQPDDFPPDFPLENAPDGAMIPFRRVVVEDTPRHRHSLRRFCEACGVAASKTVNVTEFVGAEVVLSIQHDEYNGVNREDVREVSAR